MSPYEDSHEADERNQFSDRYRHRLIYSQRLITLLTAIGSMLATVALAFMFTRTSLDARHADAEGKASIERVLESERQKMSQEREGARQRVDELEKKNADLADQLKKLQSGKPVNYLELNPADRDQINHIKSDEEQLQSRLGKLEEALEVTPEKALSTVMVKQRLDTLQDRTRGDIDSIHGEIGRLFTLTQWFIGLIFTISLTVFGLALANLRKPKST
jgi:hypothetical protein